MESLRHLLSSPRHFQVLTTLCYILLRCASIPGPPTHHVPDPFIAHARYKPVPRMDGQQMPWAVTVSSHKAHIKSSICPFSPMWPYSSVFWPWELKLQTEYRREKWSCKQCLFSGKYTPSHSLLSLSFGPYTMLESILLR